VIDESGFFLVQKLLLRFRLNACAEISSGRVPQQDPGKQGRQNFGVDPVLGRKPDNLPSEGHDVVEHVAVM